MDCNKATNSITITQEVPMIGQSINDHIAQVDKVIMDLNVANTRMTREKKVLEEEIGVLKQMLFDNKQMFEKEKDILIKKNAALVTELAEVRKISDDRKRALAVGFKALQVCKIKLSK